MQPSPNDNICRVAASIALTISYPYISRWASNRNTTSSGTPFKKLGLVFFDTNGLIPFTVRCCQHQTVRCPFGIGFVDEWICGLLVGEIEMFQSARGLAHSRMLRKVVVHP